MNFDGPPIPTTGGTPLRLDGIGSPVVVAFLPAAFTDAARAVLRAVPAALPCRVVGTDSVPVLAAFAAECGATAVVLASDPTEQVRTRLGAAEGGAVLLDPTGAVVGRWAHMPEPADLDRALHPPRRSTSDRLFLLPLALLGAFAVVSALGFWTYTTDDAFITLRYAWHLVHGEGLVFNPGEPVEGYSNPTWLFVLTLPLLMGVDPMAFGKGLGALLYGATVVLVGLTTWRLVDTRDRLAQGTALLGALLTATSLPLTWWAAGNLETPFYAFLLTAAFWRILTEAPGAFPWSAILVGFAGFSRPEAPLVAAALAGARWLHTGRESHHFRRWLLVAAAPILAWYVFRIVTYGDLVPNTYYHKGGQASVEEILDYYGPFVRNEWPFVAAILVGLAGIGLRLRRHALPVLVVLSTHLLFLAAVGGDWMPNQRFLAPALPLFATTAGAGFALLVRRAPARVPGWVFVALAGLLGVLQAARGLAGRIAEFAPDGSLSITARDAGDWPTRSFRSGFGGSNNVVVTWLLHHVPAGASVAYSEVGLMAYAGGWIVQDLVGLTDRDLGGATGLDVPARVEVVHQRRPDWIVLREGGTQNIRAIRAAPWLREEYDIQGGPKQLLVARRKDLVDATPAQALENFERAVAVAPGFPGFHDARITLAMQIGDESQKAAACEDLERALPYGQDRIRRCRNALAGKAEYARAEAAVNPTADPAEGPPAGEVPQTSPEVVRGPRKQGVVGLGWMAIPKEYANQRVRIEGDTLVVDTTGATPVPAACQEGVVTVSGTVKVRWEWRYEGVEPDGKKGARMTARMLDVAGAVLPGGFTPAGGMQLLQNARGSHDWEVVEATATVPTGAVSTRICLDLPAKAGTVWVKGLTVGA